MNIFLLDERPETAAILHCDKHVVKMPLETAQLLCTAHHVIDEPQVESGLYKPTHVNHPCAVWVRESKCNYLWTFRLFRALSLEYQFRYGKVHKSWDTLECMLRHPPVGLTNTGMTPFALCMPDEYKQTDPVQSYVDYYVAEKQDILEYTKRHAPPWAPITFIEDY